MVEAIGASSTMEDARVACEDLAKRPLSQDALISLFARHRPCCGLRSPGSYLKDPPHQARYTGAPVADLLDDIEEPSFRDTLSGFSMPQRPVSEAEPCRIHIDHAPEPANASRPTIVGYFVDVPDNHYPYESKGAVAVAQAVAHYWLSKATTSQWTALVLGGDFIDCYPVSRFFKDPARSGRIQYEIDAANQGLDAYDAIGAQYKFYQEGNHERRLPMYISEKCPAFVGLKGTTVPEMLRLPERGWQWVSYNADMWLGHLMLTHDVGRCGKYAVHQSIADIQQHTVIHHVHRMTTVYEPDAFGNVRFGGTFGCLLDMNKVDYGQRRKVMRTMVHGVGCGVIDSNGMPWMTPVPIVGESYAVVDGHVITAHDRAA